MAANSISVKLQGVEGFKAKALNLIGSVRRGTGDTVAETLLLIETQAKLLSPVDTGLNRAEIHSELAPNRLSGEVLAGTYYAVFLEFGTIYMAAQPFLFPAYEMYRAQFITRLKANLKFF